MNLIDCLENVVGISETDCECFVVPEPEEGEDAIDPTLSLSGLFVDDMEDGIPLIFPENARDCGDGNIFELIVRARKEAIKDFQTEFGTYLTEFQSPRYPDIISPIGDIEKKKNIPLAVDMNDYLGVYWKSKRVRGSVMSIPKIQIKTQSGLTDSVFRILSSVDDYQTSVIPEITFSTTTNVLTDIPMSAPAYLPLTDQQGNAVHYSFMYERQGQLPYNYKLWCGCTSKPKPAWSKYGDAVGINVASFDDIANWDKVTNRTYGLVIDARISCRSLDWICRPHDEDWINQPYFRVIAKVLQLMHINKLIGYILNSSKMNRYTLVKTEFLYGKRNHNRKQIAERMAWLSQEVPVDVADCWTCKQGQRIHKTSLLV